MCSLWRENYSKDTPSLSYKIVYFYALTTLFPPSHFPFSPQLIKKMEAFALLLQKKSIFVERKRS